MRSRYPLVGHQMTSLWYVRGTWCCKNQAQPFTKSHLKRSLVFIMQGNEAIFHRMMVGLENEAFALLLFAVQCSGICAHVPMCATWNAELM